MKIELEDNNEFVSYGVDEYSKNQNIQSSVNDYSNSNDGNNGLAIASMVFGILSLISSCCSFVMFPISSAVTIIIAMIAIVLGVIWRITENRSGKGMALCGLICGIIGLLVSIMFIVMSIFFAMIYILNY